MSSHATWAQRGTAPVPRTLKGRVGLFVDSGCWLFSCINSIGVSSSSTVDYCLGPTGNPGNPGKLYFLTDGSSYYMCQGIEPTTTSTCKYLTCFLHIPVSVSWDVNYCYANGQFGAPGELYIFINNLSYYICPND